MCALCTPSTWLPEACELCTKRCRLHPGFSRDALMVRTCRAYNVDELWTHTYWSIVICCARLGANVETDLLRRYWLSCRSNFLLVPECFARIRLQPCLARKAMASGILAIVWEYAMNDVQRRISVCPASDRKTMSLRSVTYCHGIRQTSHRLGYGRTRSIRAF